MYVEIQSIEEWLKIRRNPSRHQTDQVQEAVILLGASLFDFEDSNTDRCSNAVL